jgi:hypothetical protein
VECYDGNLAQGSFSVHEFYEFKIAYTDVWNTTTPSANQVAGFALIVTDDDGPTTWTWGSDSPPTDLSPDTWGHLEIPEFPGLTWIAVPTALVFLAGIRRRRNRAANS